jgi:hypothetical protein
MSQIDVRYAVTRAGHRVTRDLHGTESGTFDEPGGERVVGDGKK